MELDKQIRYTDVESQYKDHNTGIKGFNDRLDQTFMENIWKEPPPLDKWESLRNLLKADIAHNVSYSSDKNWEHGVTKRYLNYMDELDEREKKHHIKDHTQIMAVKPSGFLFTDVPEFDRATWKKMLENLEGLS